MLLLRILVPVRLLGKDGRCIRCAQAMLVRDAVSTSIWVVHNLRCSFMGQDPVGPMKLRMANSSTHCFDDQFLLVFVGMGNRKALRIHD
eukprot:scaffold1312_cov393-Prasinococcus_capsulatus_cf.AAC.17